MPAKSETLQDLKRGMAIDWQWSQALIDEVAAREGTIDHVRPLGAEDRVMISKIADVCIRTHVVVERNPADIACDELVPWKYRIAALEKISDDQTLVEIGKTVARGTEPNRSLLAQTVFEGIADETTIFRLAMYEECADSAASCVKKIKNRLFLGRLALESSSVIVSHKAVEALIEQGDNEWLTRIAIEQSSRSIAVMALEGIQVWANVRTVMEDRNTSEHIKNKAKRLLERWRK
jgi:hypothetical protein